MQINKYLKFLRKYMCTSTIIWEKAQTLQDKMLYYYYNDSENFYKFYLLFIEKEVFQKALRDFHKHIKSLHDISKIERDSISKVIKKRKIPDESEIFENKYILLYIGITKTYLARRLCEREQALRVAINYLNILPSNIYVIKGNILENNNQIDYEQAEASLIYKYQPIFQRSNKKNPKNEKLKLYNKWDDNEFRFGR